MAADSTGLPDKAKKVSDSTHAKFKRGEGVAVSKVANKALRGRLRHAEHTQNTAVKDAKKVYEWLQPTSGGYLEAEGLERTRQFKQQDIVQAVGEGVKNLAFDLKLPLGPYKIAMDRSGRNMALAGASGHLALTDWPRYHLMCEAQVKETTHDVCILHNEQFFAAAQKKYVYIYDRTGAEVHCCQEHHEPLALDFLPHHFLLASCGKPGVLSYQDTTHGKIVAQHKPKLGPLRVMRSNPWNATICLGHGNGRVTMWTPNLSTAAVSMQCHLGSVLAVALDSGGRYMATAGADKRVHVWDLRNSYKQLHTYAGYPGVTSLDISQKGLLAAGFGSKVHIWKDGLAQYSNDVYMQHQMAGCPISSVRFCPYQDVLAIGHAEGLSTILVPGAGEPNFDSFVANPYQTSKQRREGEVHQVLDKLQPETIMMDPSRIGKISKLPAEVQKEKAREAIRANEIAKKDAQLLNDGKTRMKGKNVATKRHRKRQNNIIEERTKKAAKNLHQEQAERKAKVQAELAEERETVPRALWRLHQRGT